MRDTSCGGDAQKDSGGPCLGHPSTLLVLRTCPPPPGTLLHSHGREHLLPQDLQELRAVLPPPAVPEPRAQSGREQDPPGSHRERGWPRSGTWISEESPLKGPRAGMCLDLPNRAR